MPARKRVRDTGTGQIVKPEEAEKRPKETVSESTAKDGLAKRVALIEAVLDESRLGPLYRRRKLGLTD